MQHSKCEKIIRKYFSKVTIISLAILLVMNISQSIQLKHIAAELKETETVSEVETLPAPTVTSLGEYTITAYCACAKCCGQWAVDRPDGIVKGAAGTELVSGYSCASNSFEFGTELIIEGYGNVVVEDRTADWVDERYDGKLVDIYFANHEKALNFGKRVLEVKTYSS